MNDRIKYCRFKNYSLQVQSETSETINVITNDWETGKTLNLICHDRDHFTKEIPKKDIDCIWTIDNNRNFYDSIKIELGTITVSTFEKQIDFMNSKFIVNGEFANYKGTTYRSLSGYGHESSFKLESNEKSSQELGFIMEKPGKFYKVVNREEIKFGFVSNTLCLHQEKEFHIVDSNLNGDLLIEPYRSNLYTKEDLLSMNFEIINTKLTKWISPTQADKIWTLTEKIYDFDKFENNDRTLYEK